MRTSRALLTLAALAAVPLVWTARAQAQSYGSRNYVPNTYADFPYNQGSLFYRPLGRTAYTRPRSAAPSRRYVTPRYYAPQNGYYYPQQQPTQYYYSPQGYYRAQ